jgi:hypothetical protein
MAGDMSKCRAAAAKLEDSTTLANTAIPVKRSKREPLEANAGLTQVPPVLLRGRALFHPAQPVGSYWFKTCATTPPLSLQRCAHCMM